MEGSSRLAYPPSATARSRVYAAKRVGSARRVRCDGAVALRCRGPRRSPPERRSCPSAIEPVSPREADPAGPVGGRHRALAERADLTQLDGSGGGPDEDGALRHVERAGGQRAQVVRGGGARAQRADLEPLPAE